MGFITCPGRSERDSQTALEQSEPAQAGAGSGGSTMLPLCSLGDCCLPEIGLSKSACKCTCITSSEGPEDVKGYLRVMFKGGSVGKVHQELSPSGGLLLREFSCAPQLEDWVDWKPQESRACVQSLQSPCFQ